MAKDRKIYYITGDITGKGYLEDIGGDIDGKEYGNRLYSIKRDIAGKG